ncbi:interleukin-15 receptor subunit alpha [Elgaria multicarinata webbii]|uniref:interleukin-15 receptor subunit alpha n=1 Tax=Elgaria multicarinata webbii TaxID=159646 RepID=UPI002FCCEF13
MEGSTSTKLRYSCAKNYKRKAGTSSLIVCKQDENTKEFRWTKAQLSCIRDPSRPIPQPETTTEDSRRDALYGGIVPTILVVLVFIVGAVLWNRCRRQGYFLRQTEVPHEEEMASLGSEGGGGSQNIPSASDLSDTGAGNEGAAILSAHGATSTS